MEKYDLAIVGGGIAGCSALWYARKKNKRVIWFDRPDLNSSSSVAAGMLNPIVLRRFTKSWYVDTLLPFAQEFYKTIDQTFSISSFHEYPIYRVFASEDERKLWLDKMNDERFQKYLGLPEKELTLDSINDPFGYGLIKEGGYLDLKLFMFHFRNWAQKDESVLYREETLNHDDLKKSESVFHYDDFEFEKILFCEGTGIHNNPFFNYLPYRRTKGEVLKVKLSDLPIKEKILSRGVFCLPIESLLFKIGATFTHNDFSLDPTEDGKNQVLEKFKKLYKGEVKTENHIAGLRPTVKDRRPLLGEHPLKKNMFIFNGLGTKGVLLAPYFANAIINYTFEQESIQSEVDINRFEQQT